MKHEITNLAASVNQRLLNLRNLRKEDFQIILNRYGLERFLYRLSESPFADRLILKGAFSFELWGQQFYRPTRDADFVGFFEPSAEEIRRVFIQVCHQDVEPDGLLFNPESVSAEAIRGQNAMGGLRVQLTAYLARIRIHLQFDVVIGEPMTTMPRKMKFPALLSFPPPRILVYPKELTVADKFHALCKQGMLNSRIKDYYDIFQLALHFAFKGTELKSCIQMIFKQEKFAIPSGIPDALSDEFGQSPEKKLLWKQFLIRIAKDSLSSELGCVIECIRDLVLPPAKAAAEDTKFDLLWPAGGPWRPREKRHDG